jgi:hypothetical protein
MAKRVRTTNPNRIRRLEFKTGKIITRTRSAMSDAFDTVAKEMTMAVRKDLTGLYPPASRPGSPPHIRTGRLLNNFEVTRKGYQMFVRMPQYGFYLEQPPGWKVTKINLRPRPFVKVNLFTKDKQLTWTRRINAEIRKNVNKANNK